MLSREELKSRKDFLRTRSIEIQDKCERMPKLLRSVDPHEDLVEELALAMADLMSRFLDLEQAISNVSPVKPRFEALAI